MIFFLRSRADVVAADRNSPVQLMEGLNGYQPWQDTNDCFVHSSLSDVILRDRVWNLSKSSRLLNG
jgi:hypothetical protein